MGTASSGGQTPDAAANGRDKELGGSADAQSGNTQPGPPAPPPDEFADAKEQLRKLTVWIIGVFGAIAGITVAGSQLSDLGALDTTRKVTLFGWTRTRFEFGVI